MTLAHLLQNLVLMDSHSFQQNFVSLRRLAFAAVASILLLCLVLANRTWTPPAVSPSHPATSAAYPGLIALRFQPAGARVPT